MKKTVIMFWVLTFVTCLLCMQTAYSADNRESIDISGHYIKGPANAKATIAIFSDYLCPYCKRLEPIIKSVIEKYPADVKVVHIQLTNHDFSQKAVYAVYAAGRQGKFTEYHDLLFENQKDLDDDLLLKLSKRLNLEEHKFKSDLKNPETAKLIEMDTASGYMHEVHGTPTVYVNGLLLTDRSLNGLVSLIEREIRK